MTSGGLFSPRVCFHCRQPGHFIAHCPQSASGSGTAQQTARPNNLSYTHESSFHCRGRGYQHPPPQQTHSAAGSTSLPAQRGQLNVVTQEQAPASVSAVQGLQEKQPQQ